MAQLQRLAIAPEQIEDRYISLSIEQQHYLRRVLRLQGGDRFIAINGQGQWWLAELQGSPTQAQMIESLAVQTELPVPLTLLTAPAKGKSFEDVVRSSTELGVTCIVPLLSQRTLLHPSAHKLDRWRRIATEAAEQAQRQIIPEIIAPMSFAQALEFSQGAALTQHAHYMCVTDPSAPNLLRRLEHMPGSGIMVMTGPEGGWTAAEQAEATAVGYEPVSLGQRVLRAVTAPLAALAVIATYLETIGLTQEEFS